MAEYFVRADELKAGDVLLLTDDEGVRRRFTVDWVSRTVALNCVGRVLRFPGDATLNIDRPEPAPIAAGEKWPPCGRCPSCKLSAALDRLEKR